MNLPLEKSIEINCGIEHAFDVFILQIDTWWPTGHRKFEQSKLSLAQQVGGEFLEISADGQQAKMGEVMLYEAPNRICYTWFPGAINMPTYVDIRFTQQNEMTLVEVTHSEGDSQLGEVWPQRVTIFTKSWDTILNSIKTHIESE